MVGKPLGAAEDENIARTKEKGVDEGVGEAGAAEQKDGGLAKREGHQGMGQVPFGSVREKVKIIFGKIWKFL